jgi:hypothetical protein
MLDMGHYKRKGFTLSKVSATAACHLSLRF